MKKNIARLLMLLFFFAVYAPALAVEVAPHISDREIVEKLSRLEEGQKSTDKRFDAIDKRIDDLRIEMNTRFEELRADMNARFNLLTWLIGLFISISIVIMGFMFQLQRQMAQRITELEKVWKAHGQALETQKDEINFLKGLIEKLLPPKGVL